MEEAFRWIEQGNQACHDSDWWRSAECYGQAFLLLRECSSSSSPHNNQVTDDEATQIAQLCFTQSVEYKEKARDCFVKALQESNRDVESNNTDVSRIELFSQLFSASSSPPPPNSTLRSTVSHQEDDLSRRLQALHAFSIPNASNHRSKLDELNAGLRRLGLKPVESANNKNNNKSTVLLEVHPSVGTQVEQVDALLQQVQEQMSLLGTETNNNNDNTSNKEDDASTSASEQVNQVIQQVRDEQAFDESTVVSDDDDDDLSTTSSSSTCSSSSSNPGDGKWTHHQVLKHMKSAELLLVQVMASLEESSTIDRTLIQTQIRRARKVLHQAELHC